MIWRTDARITRRARDDHEDQSAPGGKNNERHPRRAAHRFAVFSTGWGPDTDTLIGPCSIGLRHGTQASGKRRRPGSHDPSLRKSAQWLALTRASCDRGQPGRGGGTRWGWKGPSTPIHGSRS